MSPWISLHCAVFAGTVVFTSLSVAAEFTLLDASAPARALIPAVANGGSTLGVTWTAIGFDDAPWQSGTTGVGYDADPAGVNYLPLVGLNVQPMRNVNGSVFIRVPFTVNAADLPNFRQLKLNMKVDDGFVAYINGTKVISALEPDNVTWNSLTLNNDTHEASLTTYEPFDITEHLGVLQAGSNVLAIHGLNGTLGSSDLLMMPQLIASDVPPPPPLPWPELSFVEAPIIGAVNFPTAVRNAGDGSNRLFVVERLGLIRVLHNGAFTTFLDIRDRVTSSTSPGNERGLLGLAFTPGFGQTKSHFYVYYTREVPVGTIVQRLSRFRLVPTVPPSGVINAADPSSEEILLPIPDPYSNHNGGDMYFGTDGYLYLSLGDGGDANDPQNRAQNPNELWGKMVRLDVEGAIGTQQLYLVPSDNPFVGQAGARGEIWHLGLRNPWRWSFDRLTGDMWIGDVGQGAFEEIDYVPGNLPARNFGWKRYEGFDLRPGEPATGGTALTLGTLTPPVTAMSSGTGDRSVTGGFVYRGKRFPRMQGVYFFADYLGERLYGLQRNALGDWQRQTLIPNTNVGIVSFGEDEAGELYFAHLGGSANAGRIYQVRDSRDFRYLEIYNVARNDLTGRVSFNFGAALGRTYQVQTSTDLQIWDPLGPPIAPIDYEGAFSEAIDPPPDEDRRYFRVREN
ncbi:MAG: PQQ-dependent sugar dehydrogenase [Verrucomicrobiales bacterium]